MFLGWSQSAAVLRADGLSCGCLSTLKFIDKTLIEFRRLFRGAGTFNASLALVGHLNPVSAPGASARRQDARAGNLRRAG